LLFIIGTFFGHEPISLFKSIDTTTQILCIHALSTTDQIENLLEIGLQMFFKPCKQNWKKISGDFYITTSLPFDQLQYNENMQTWFYNHGYNITFSGCQLAHMVKVGFLARVQGFTCCNYLYSYITNVPEYKKFPFHMWLYYHSFSINAKSSLTYALMVDIDHPNIDVEF